MNEERIGKCLRQVFFCRIHT